MLKKDIEEDVNETIIAKILYLKKLMWRMFRMGKRERGFLPDEN